MFFQDELVKVLESWDKEREDLDVSGQFGVNDLAMDHFQREIASQPDPVDPRLRLPSKNKSMPRSKTPPRSRPLQESLVPLPDGSSASVVDVMLLLDEILDSKDRLYKAHKYKNCFVNHDAVVDIMNYFGCSRGESITFLRKLHSEHGILHHVCDDHAFRDDGSYLFFRLQCYHQPDVLNSFRVWKLPEDTEEAALAAATDAPAVVSRLKTMLDKILQRHTDPTNGLIDYIAARKDTQYPNFEEATCELQGKLELTMPS